MTRTLTHQNEVEVDAEQLRRLPRALVLVRLGAVLVLATALALFLI